MPRWISKIAIADTLLVVGMAPLANAQQVWVVGPPGPGVFSQEIQPAIDAAANRDIVLVKSNGTYPYWPFTLTKGLSVIAEAGATVRANGSCYVTIGASSGGAYLRGISCAELNVNGSQGPVWIESCSAFTTSGLMPNGSGAFNIANSASVVLLHCSATGMAGFDGGNMDPSLYAFSSNVYAWDCSFIGAPGPTLYMLPQPSLHGSAGARILGGTLFASGTFFRGGPGGPYYGSDPTGLGESGGAGLSISGATVSLLACNAFGGAGGTAAGGNGPNGPNFEGAPLPTFLPGVARGMTVSSPVREGAIATFTLKGLPGEYAAIYFSLDQMIGQPHLDFGGIFVASLLNASTSFVGTIPGSTIVQLITAPNLPPTILGATVYAQAFFFNVPLTYAVIGPASAVVVLDSSL